MIRVLIADDEKRIRDGLSVTIPWADLGMEVVGVAAHGEAALALARETRPQIILTDVRMPRMDGLEFLKQTKAFLPRVRVVILSGYDDFSYAQQAVKLGVSEYLVKPVGAETIQSVLVRLAHELADEPEEAEARPSPAPAHRLVEAVERGDPQAAYAALGEWRRGGVRDGTQARQEAIDLVDLVIQHLRRDGYEFREGDSPSPAAAHSTVLGLEEPSQVEAWLDRQIGALATFVDRNNRNNRRLIVRRALEIIEAGSSGDLSIEQVAQAVGLSPNYFSHLFKRVRGQGFRETLNEVRIAKAKALLEAGGHKVYEVAQMVGFSDYKYFAAVFKKVTGTAPTRPGRTRSRQDE